MKKNTLFATDLLYKPLGHESFDAVKKSFFEQKLSNYYTEMPLERWQWLKNAFCDVIPQPGVQATLSTFMDARHEVSTSEFVLSLEQCLDYFERFYFLYQNNDPVYHLSDSAKASFLSLMRQAITNTQLCETGRFRRFEALIMEFRSDKNWIDNLLQKQRYLIINALQEAYNHEKNVYAGYHIHTLDVMQRAAQEKNLGVPQLHALADIHMSAGSEQSIKAYFEQHYPARFEAYENNAINNISEQVLLKLTELLQLNKINTNQWETSGLVLPNGYQIKLMPSNRQLPVAEMEQDTVYLYLQDMDFQGDQIYGITQYGVPFPLIETLKQIEPDPNEVVQPRDVDFEEIKQMLREGKSSTLPDAFQEQLIISSLEKRGGRSYYTINQAFLTFLNDYLQLSDITEIRTAFLSDLDSEAWEIKPKQTCLAQIKHYVENMMLDKQYFLSHTRLYEDDFDMRSVPLRLTDNITIEMLEEVSQRIADNRLTRASFVAALNHEQSISILLHYPFILLRQLKNDFHVLTGLPSTYKSNHLLMDEVLSFFCEQINPMIEANDAEKIHLIMQDFFALIGEEVGYFERLPESLRHHELIEPLLTEQKQKHLKNKQDPVLSLTTAPTITLNQFVQLTQQITPLELADVIQNRATNATLLPLPFCHDSQFFSKFCDELISAGDWSNYLDYKQQLIDSQSETLAAGYFISSESWFLAYMRYQHHYSYFDSQYDVKMHLHQVRLTLHGTFNLFIGILLPMLVVLSPLLFDMYKNGPSKSSILTHSDWINMCTSQLPYDENHTDMIDAFRTCSDMTPNWGDSFQLFLKKCIIGLTQNVPQMDSIRSFDQCLHKQRSGEDFPWFPFLFCMALLYPTMRAIIFYKKNPYFSDNTLDFSDEAQRFIHRVQGTLTIRPEMPLAENMLERCEDSIVRLQGLDNRSAHQKAEHLKCALDDVKTELHVEPLSDYQISQRLQEQSSVVHQGETHRLSFWSIAAQKRNADTFNLAAIDDVPRVPTTTVKHLTTAPFAQWFKQSEKVEGNNDNVRALEHIL